MVVEPYNERESRDVFAIDGRGRPTTYLSFMILKMMFSEPNRWFTSKELRRLLVANRRDTDLICRQLVYVDLISENATLPGQYQYNINSTNIDVQAGFEKFLVDVELESLPVNSMLDFSPSSHSRRYL